MGQCCSWRPGAVLAVKDPDFQINYKQAFNKIWKTPAHAEFNLYHLISPRNHMTLTATQRQRAEDPDLQINYKQAFNKIWKTPATRRIQSTFWKMLSNALPRAPHGKQACPHCGDPETTYHIFWDCTEALLVYVHTSSIWSKWTGDRIHLFSPMDIFNMGAPTQDVSSQKSMTFNFSLMNGYI
jgi:hypothetical protein